MDNNKIMVSWNGKPYEAKILEKKEEGGQKLFKVHYLNFKKKWDEWIPQQRILSSEPNFKEPEPEHNTIQQNKELEDIRSENEELKNEIKELKREQTNAIQEKKELESQLTDIRSENEELKNEIKELKRENEIHKTNKEEFENKIQQLHREKKLLLEENQNITDTATNLRRSVEILEFLKTAKRKRTYEEIEEIDEEIVGEGEEGEEDEDETNNQCNYMKYSEENDEVEALNAGSSTLIGKLEKANILSNKKLTSNEVACTTLAAVTTAEFLQKGTLSQLPQGTIDNIIAFVKTYEEKHKVEEPQKEHRLRNALNHFVWRQKSKKTVQPTNPKRKRTVKRT